MALITGFFNKLLVTRLLQTLDFAMFNFSDPANKVIAIIFLGVQPVYAASCSHPAVWRGGVLPIPGSREMVSLDSELFPLAVCGSCLVEGLGWSFPFLMTTRTSLCSCAWCRTFRTSPWAKPASEAPLTDRRKSPRFIVPSWKAAPWENNLWT